MTAISPPVVLAIQHVSSEPLGTLSDSLTLAGISVRPVRVDQGDSIPASISDARGLIVMGGPMGVYEADRFSFLRDELRLIEDALRLDRPVLGICLGAQLLAAVLGSRVYPSGVREIGWFPVTLSPSAGEDPLFSRATESFEAFHWHGDTYDLPTGAIRLASSAATREQAFRFGRAWGVQFHLEVTPAVVAAMIDGADAELAAAGARAADLSSGMARHGERLEAVARDVFGSWALLVTEEETR